MLIGRVREIWRYPVKSMMGEQLTQAELDPGGLPGDRAWAVRDEVRGGIRGAKKIAGLMRLAARYVSPPKRDQVSAPEIALLDGTSVRADASDAAARVSAAVETSVTLWPLMPAEALEHYRRGAPDHEDLETELRAIFGRTKEEPLPDLSKFPPEIFVNESPAGTYFDAYPLLLLTTATLDTLALAAPESRVDVRRFRPNIVIETLPELSGYVEAAWTGRTLRVGALTIEATIACPRCVMVTHGFADLPRDPPILRAIVRDADQKIGMYARPVDSAAIQVGDTVELV
jgi:uncharacterized protein YcbX